MKNKILIISTIIPLFLALSCNEDVYVDGTEICKCSVAEINVDKSGGDFDITIVSPATGNSCYIWYTTVTWFTGPVLKLVNYEEGKRPHPSLTQYVSWNDELYDQYFKSEYQIKLDNEYNTNAPITFRYDKNDVTVVNMHIEPNTDGSYREFCVEFNGRGYTQVFAQSRLIVRQTAE